MTDDSPHDVPSATELLDAVEQFLRLDVLPTLEGRLAYHVRVSANVLAMVARQMELGPEQHRRHGERLAQLGVADDTQLAAAIRSGALDDRLDEVRRLLRQGVADKLAVANPGYTGESVP